jgi:Leucine-rich repeat (LRR) protein
MESLSDLRKPVTGNGEIIPVLIGWYGDYKLFKKLIQILSETIGIGITIEKLFDFLVSLRDKSGFNIISSAVAAGNYKLFLKLDDNFGITKKFLKKSVPGTVYTVKELVDSFMNKKETLITKESALVDFQRPTRGLLFVSDRYFKGGAKKIEKSAPVSSIDVKQSKAPEIVCKMRGRSLALNISEENKRVTKRFLSRLFEKCGTKIKSFGILHSFVNKFPINIEEMSGIEQLILTNVGRVSDKISAYKNLRSIDLSGSKQVSRLSDEILKLPRLRFLNLQDTNVRIVPLSIANKGVLSPNGNHIFVKRQEPIEKKKERLCGGGFIPFEKEGETVIFEGIRLDDESPREKIGIFESFFNARKVIFRNCSIEELPAWISRARKLRELVCECCTEKDLQSKRGDTKAENECRALRKIDNIIRLQKLEKLTLIRSSITKLPPNFSRLKKLKVLVCRNCENLQNIDGVEGLSNLEEIDLEGAKLDHLPLSIAKLPIKKLNLSGTKITFISLDFSRQDSIAIAYDSGKKIVGKPKSINLRKRLHSAGIFVVDSNLFSTDYRKRKKQFELLRKIAENRFVIDNSFSEQEIESILESRILDAVADLQRKITFRKLENLDSKISRNNNKCIRSIAFEYCDMRKVPEWLMDMKQLEELHIHTCKNIGSLSDEIQKLDHLKKFKLTSQKKLRLPRSIAKLPLEFIDLRGTKVEQLYLDWQSNRTITIIAHTRRKIVGKPNDVKFRKELRKNGIIAKDYRRK